MATSETRKPDHELQRMAALRSVKVRRAQARRRKPEGWAAREARLNKRAGAGLATLPVDPDAALTARQARLLLNISPATMWRRLRTDPTFPKPNVDGRFRRGDVVAYARRAV